MDVEFTVNGRRHRLALEPRETLAEVLRDRLALKGTKLSCEMQVCGACTVLVDGRPVSACTYLAFEADGRLIETIEGLAEGDNLHPLQRAFADTFALQCGFCTPGMIMTAKALLRERPRPTADEVRAFLRGNICRCTGYKRIVEAVLRAATALRGDGRGR